MIQRKSPVELRVRQDIFSSTSGVAAHFTERMHVQFNWGRISRSKIEGYRARQALQGRLAVNFRDRREPPGMVPRRTPRRTSGRRARGYQRMCNLRFTTPRGHVFYTRKGGCGRDQTAQGVPNGRVGAGRGRRRLPSSLVNQTAGRGRQDREGRARGRRPW